MREIKKDTYVLNKNDNKMYRYVGYAEEQFSHILLDETNDDISLFATTKEIFVVDEDILVEIQDIIDYLTAKVKAIEKENNQYRKDIAKPLDKGLGLARKNTLTGEIYQIKKDMFRNVHTPEESYQLSKELEEKEDALHLVNLRLNHTLFLDYANLEIEKNNKKIVVCKESLAFAKKIRREENKGKKKEKKMNTMDLVINLEMVVVGDIPHYRVISVENSLLNDLFTVVNYDGEPIAAIEFSTMVDNGDYNYDDEYEENYYEEFSYTRIYFSPLTGRKIVFNIVNEVNETARFCEMDNIVRKYAHRKRFKKEERELFEKAKLVLKEINDGLIPLIWDCD